MPADKDQNYKINLDALGNLIASIGLTNRELCKRAGIPPALLNQILLGTPVAWRSVKDIARALNADIDILLGKRVAGLDLSGMEDFIADDANESVKNLIENTIDSAIIYEDFEKELRQHGSPVRWLEDKVAELFVGLPEIPEKRLEAVSDRVDAFREEAARQLQDALNSYLEEIARIQKAGTGQGRLKFEDALSFDEKQNIVDIVNFQLDRLGLAISYKENACNFACTGGTSQGRFLLVPKGSKTALLARVNLSDFLPLELIDAQPDREPPKPWRDREQDRRTTRTETRQK